MEILKSGTVIACPNCQAPQEDVVEEYVAPVKLSMLPSPREDHECHNCYEIFSVIQISIDEFEVKLLSRRIK